MIRHAASGRQWTAVKGSEKQGKGSAVFGGLRLLVTAHRRAGARGPGAAPQAPWGRGSWAAARAERGGVHGPVTAVHGGGAQELHARC